MLTHNQLVYSECRYMEQQHSQTCRLQAEQEKVQQTCEFAKLCYVGLLAQYIIILCMLNSLGCYVSILI